MSKGRTAEWAERYAVRRANLLLQTTIPHLYL